MHCARARVKRRTRKYRSTGENGERTKRASKLLVTRLLPFLASSDPTSLQGPFAHPRVAHGAPTFASIHIYCWA
ncbi:hypothetical protein C8F04DRAFT_1273297 [Mycena alexandri]|uniref:Uncharacterized protein n=1 Tax=Mycena alexandri TaxID=1745969 RepID=A0AAD6WQU4_9AGAR|nr:hypothetical protein C8F04DRAFT_1275270 [Mycena alexandri]KAJ7021804.1 hypothetical protein C8F04DRAFT_1273297 [Mycena alexandri]